METSLKPAGRFNRRRFLGAGALGAGTLALAACGSNAAKGVASAAATAPSTPQATAAAAQPTLAAQVYLTIVTGGMIDKKDWPAYIPSAFTIPAHSRVDFTITNFDGATPLPSDIFAKVSGTVGNVISVEPLTVTDPNASGKATSVAQVDPKQVGHTFTAPGLGNLNVPVLGTSRVRFAIDTGAPGTFAWQCLDPCGSGPDGTGGGMKAEGYMRGTITVA